jgi:hypothetical protein
MKSKRRSKCLFPKCRRFAEHDGDHSRQNTHGNTRKTGGKKLLGNGIDPSVGKAMQIQSGEVRNSGGRPEMADKSPKNPVSLRPRQAKLLEGIVGGKSLHRAALDAGYSRNTADHPADLLGTKSMRAALQALLPPVEKIAQRINEGLDATKTEFAKFEGAITDTRECVDFAERRQYVELACRLKELLPGDGDRGTPETPLIDC